ncbi:transmembrane p24 trafficking protein 4 [Phyllostomus discolor]|nr:transmembrane p24 trafficking protein 4 [Phyllostomus discolor]
MALFAGGRLRVHLDIQVGEHANNYPEIAAKDKLTELQLRARQLLDQVEQIQKEQDYQRVRACRCPGTWQLTLTPTTPTGVSARGLPNELFRERKGISLEQRFPSFLPPFHPKILFRERERETWVSYLSPTNPARPRWEPGAKPRHVP